MWKISTLSLTLKSINIYLSLRVAHIYFALEKCINCEVNCLSSRHKYNCFSSPTIPKKLTINRIFKKTCTIATLLILDTTNNTVLINFLDKQIYQLQHISLSIVYIFHTCLASIASLIRKVT